MKRLFALLTVCVLLTGVLCLPASAESAASRVDVVATVNSEGDCMVTMTVVLHLETAHDKLTFPLPLVARDITMNNSPVSTRKDESAIHVDISRMARDYVGDLQLVFNFSIPEAVKVVKINETPRLQLTIPMLSGFEYPVNVLSFTINMPADVESCDPTFTSIYRQSSIESDLTVLTRNNQIIGSSKTALNDHDGVTMQMLVPEEMFPTVSTYIREGNPELIPMIVFAVLAFVYWILFLRTLPLRRQRSSTAPEGITAGELGCRLTLAGGDLTMMVFSWAQLGYILIHLDGNGRVLLHKRMDMGNERSQFENKVFKALFGSRRVVEATGMQYAHLCQRVAEQIPNERNMNKGSSGNMKIFRGLACVSQIFCGICVAMNMATIPVLQIIMAIILAVFGAVSGWLIQGIAYRNHLRGKVPVYFGLGCVLIWIILGFLCGQIWIPLGASVGQWIVGYFAAYGGRRSDLGRHDASQVLGLRHYVKHLPRGDINRLMANDPDYFFNLAPYALALGVINPFARAFGRRKLDQCPYMASRVSGRRTAEEWGHFMADVADLMDSRARQLQVEKWLAVRVTFEREPAPQRKKPAGSSKSGQTRKSSGKAAGKPAAKKQPRKKQE